VQSLSQHLPGGYSDTLRLSLTAAVAGIIIIAATVAFFWLFYIVL